MIEIEDSHFHPDSVGKSHVPIQRLKRTKSRGSAVKGKLSMLSFDNYAIIPVIDTQFPTGTDAMATKVTQRRLIKVNKNQLKHPKVLDIRRTVSTRSPSSDRRNQRAMFDKRVKKNTHRQIIDNKPSKHAIGFPNGVKMHTRSLRRFLDEQHCRIN
jgi:hypothetical protein